VFWSRIGDDLNAPPLVSALEAEGIDISGLHRAPIHLHLIAIDWRAV
jgi:hypothetical protein